MAIIVINHSYQVPQLSQSGLYQWDLPSALEAGVRLHFLESKLRERLRRLPKATVYQMTKLRWDPWHSCFSCSSPLSPLPTAQGLEASHHPTLHPDKPPPQGFPGLLWLSVIPVAEPKSEWLQVAPRSSVNSLIIDMLSPEEAACISYAARVLSSVYSLHLGSETFSTSHVGWKLPRAVCRNSSLLPGNVKTTKIPAESESHLCEWQLTLVTKLTHNHCVQWNHRKWVGCHCDHDLRVLNIGGPFDYTSCDLRFKVTFQKSFWVIDSNNSENLYILF